MKWSRGEGLEILVQGPKITYLRNCPNNLQRYIFGLDEMNCSDSQIRGLIAGWEDGK